MLYTFPQNNITIMFDEWTQWNQDEGLLLQPSKCQTEMELQVHMLRIREPCWHQMEMDLQVYIENKSPLNIQSFCMTRYYSRIFH